VVAAQRTLADLGYYLGPVDGERGGAFRSAVMAFQKVQGLGADGVVGPATLKALAAPARPVLKASSPANRVEVDLTKQVLYVVKGGAIARILPVSSGNGATYEQKDGSTARALTPTGRYTIQRRIVGERKADLGTLYDPQYFYRGWAIHGSNSVPAGPASHGCVRVTRADAKWLLGAIGNGTSVYLYGGKHVFSGRQRRGRHRQPHRRHGRCGGARSGRDHRGSPAGGDDPGTQAGRDHRCPQAGRDDGGAQAGRDDGGPQAGGDHPRACPGCHGGQPGALRERQHVPTGRSDGHRGAGLPDGDGEPGRPVAPAAERGRPAQRRLRSTREGPTCWAIQSLSGCSCRHHRATASRSAGACSCSSGAACELPTGS
jgi:peptidoglycan hydrolase-like protein with peptidoglycan-binding domain